MGNRICSPLGSYPTKPSTQPPLTPRPKAQRGRGHRANRKENVRHNKLNSPSRAWLTDRRDGGQLGGGHRRTKGWPSKLVGTGSILCAARGRNETMNGGEGGIRTLDRLAPITVFETAAFDHSATSPRGAEIAGCVLQCKQAAA
jgi:hypothetical protein